MRLNVRRLLLLTGAVTLSACLFSWPEALPTSQDGGPLADASPDAEMDASSDAMTDAGIDGQAVMRRYCEEHDGGPGSRCWDFDDGGISATTFVVRAVPDAAYPTYASSEVSPPYAARFSVPVTDSGTSSGAVSSLEWIIKGNGTNRVEVEFDTILDLAEPSLGVNLAVIKGTTGPYSLKLRVASGGFSVAVQDVVEGGTTDDTVLVRLDGGTAFAPKVWHHVVIVLDLSLRTYTATVDGVSGSTGITSWWPSSGDLSVIFGLAFPGAPTTGWVARFDNVVVTAAP